MTAVERSTIYMTKMNIRDNFFRFSGLTVCLLLFSLAQGDDSEETINVATLCDRFNGTVDLRHLKHAILKYEEIWPMECKILLANKTDQFTVVSFSDWDVKGNDTLIFRDRYTELSLTGSSQWYYDKAIIFRGPTTILFSLKDKFFSTRMNRFEFLFTVSYFDLCEKQAFACNNKMCLKEQHFVCDGNNNCGDWSDEISCERMCTDNEFECANRKCIPKYQLCDDRNDCGDMSDEKICNKDCRLSHQYKCNNTICILRDQVCDNKNDCGDWSDERNCCNEKKAKENKREKADQTKVTVVELSNPWLITVIVCAAVLAIVIITFTAIFLRNKLKNKKEPTSTQPPHVQTSTNTHNPQPSNFFGRVRQSLRSARQPTPSTVQPPGHNQQNSVQSGAQTYQVPSMYPHLQSGVDNPGSRAAE